MQDWSITLYGTSTPAAKNDPIPFRNPIIRNRGNATRPVVLQAGRKNNRGKPVPVVPYTVGLVKRKKNKNSKNPNRNSQKSKQSRPATRPPLESTSARMTTASTDLSLNLRGDLADPLATDARGRKMANLFEQYPKIQRIYPAPLQAHGTTAVHVVSSKRSVLFGALLEPARRLPLFRFPPFYACRVCVVTILFRSGFI